MSDYNGIWPGAALRHWARLNPHVFGAMEQAGWAHDPKTGGFTKQAKSGSHLWVSWGQTEDAIRLAEAGEPVQGVAPQSETMAKVIASASNEP